MIPIYSKEDVKLVKDKVLHDGLLKEFDRLPDDYQYPEYGYFIVIESFEELQHPIPLQYSSLPYTPEPLSDYIEMIEEFVGYCQVVCVLEADFGVSLFIGNEVANSKQLGEFFEI